MGHGITKSDRAVFAQKAAWHGLGEVTDDALTVDAAYDKALNWTVEESIALSGVFEGEKRVATDTHKMLRRGDTGEVLGVVSAGFHVFQNRSLADLGIDLVGASSLAVESAFSMFGGKQVVMLLRGEEVTLGATGLDRHVPYMLLANGHDGSLALTVLPTVVRVVCRNTLTAALTGSRGAFAGGFRWKHTSGLGTDERGTQIRNAVRQWQLGTDSIVGVAKHLSGATLKRDQISDLWLEVVQRQMGEIPTKAEADTDKAKRRKRERATDALASMATTFSKESEVYGASAYVAANAATNWLQHEAGRRSGESRFDANTFGPVADESRAIMARALELIG